MKVYVNLLFPWNEAEQKVDPTGMTTEIGEDNYSYMGTPPALGDLIEWHPDQHDGSPEGFYEVKKRTLVVGRHTEPHFVIIARWDPWKS